MYWVEIVDLVDYVFVIGWEDVILWSCCVVGIDLCVFLICVWDL